jgi:hypothetical protein
MSRVAGARDHPRPAHKPAAEHQNADGVAELIAYRFTAATVTLSKNVL